MAETKQTPGRMVWRESSTKDVEKTKRFYGDLFGWSYEPYDMGPNGTYWMIKNGGKSVGGMMAMTGEMQMPPHWMSYVSVSDVDAAAKAATNAGGRVAYGPADIPNVGRFAVVLDPDGAAITAFKPMGGDGDGGRPSVGEFCWETLSTKDVARAQQFYTKVFGWKAGQGVNMPTFGVGDRMEDQVADVQLAQGPVPPNWLTYVVVQNADASAARAAELGGKVMMPGMDIPTIGRIAVITDDQGAALGLFQPAM